jgi:uncharacterized protein YdaU (DUF1376 family)
MKDGDVWMPLYIGDYLRDTASLTTIEHGAYLLLLMEYWINGPLPNDHKKLRAITKMSPTAYKNFIPTMHQFFTLTENKFTQKRVEREKKKLGQLLEKYRERSKKGNDAKRAKGILQGVLQGDIKETVTAPPSPSPSPNTLKTKSKTIGPAEPSPYLPSWLPVEVWGEWVKHRKSIRKPLTQRAAVLCVDTLGKIYKAGGDPVKAIEQSIERGYTGLFAAEQKVVKAQRHSDTTRDFLQEATGNDGHQGIIIDMA